VYALFGTDPDAVDKTIDKLKRLAADQQFNPWCTFVRIRAVQKCPLAIAFRLCQLKEPSLPGFRIRD